MTKLSFFLNLAVKLPLGTLTGVDSQPGALSELPYLSAESGALTSFSPEAAC